MMEESIENAPLPEPTPADGLQPSVLKTSKKRSVDEVHDHIDDLMLSVFEAVRGHTAAVDALGAESKEYVAQEKCHRITSSYNAAIEAVDKSDRY